MSSVYKLAVIVSSIYMVSTESELLCGTVKIKHPQREICCNGEIQARYQNSKEMACCTRSGVGQLYPKHEKVCCGAQLVKQNRTRRLHCCNKELIDSQTEGCCGNEDFGVKYEWKDEKTCCKVTKTREYGLHPYRDQHECCGTLLYHKYDDECDFVNGSYEVRRKSPNKPCGPHWYNPANSICCRDTGKVLKKPETNPNEHSEVKAADWVCWNDKAWDSNKHDYDTKTGRVIPKGARVCGNETYFHENKGFLCCGERLQVVNPEQLQNITCCGNQTWNLNDKLLDCCGGELISSLTQGCCSGKRFNRGYDLDCCGTRMINKTSQICCELQTSTRTVVEKQHVTHTNCCKSRETGTIETFNKYEKVCKRGRVLDEDTEPSRYTNLFNPSSTPQIQRRCPFCKPKIDETTCNKAHVYKFFVYDKRWTDNGTVLHGVILRPYELKSGNVVNGEKIRIRTRNQCRCFKMKKNFYLFTNRRIRSFDKNRYNVRFTSDDVFIPERDTKSYQTCLIYHKLALGKR